MLFLIDVLRYIRVALINIYTFEEVTALCPRIVKAACGIQEYYMLIPHDKRVEELDMEKVKGIVSRLLTHEPLDYILKHALFCDYTLYVNNYALIPRPETEGLVELITADHIKDLPLSVIDIGTGSGCIAVCLAKNLPKANIKAIDISDNAIAVARENVERMKTDNVTCMPADILDESLWERCLAGQYDIIVSNPPYVQQCERAGMQRRVLDYEPEIALFTPEDDPLVFYRAIARFGKKYLMRGGTIYVEVNALLAEETRQLFYDEGYAAARLFKDLEGRKRMLRVTNDVFKAKRRGLGKTAVGNNR